MSTPVIMNNMNMTMPMTIDAYDYKTFWKVFTFSQISSSENWEEFSFFQINKRTQDVDGLVIPPIPMQTASKESGFFHLEDAIRANEKRVTKELNRKFQEIREEKMREDAIKEKLELKAFIEAQEAKEKEAKVVSVVVEKKSFKFFKPKPHKQDVAFVAETKEEVARKQEIRKKKNIEKKVLDQARAQFFKDMTLIHKESWLIEIGKALGYETPSNHLQAIRQKLNVSSLAMPSKLVEKEDEIKQDETSALTEEQVEVLETAEKQEQEVIQTLATAFLDTFERAQQQRDREAMELKRMIAQEEESKRFNLEISRAQGETAGMGSADLESEILKHPFFDDKDFITVGKEFPVEVKFPIVYLGRSVKKVVVNKKPVVEVTVAVVAIEKKKKNRICKSLRIVDPKACDGNCCFLHNLDELNVELCKFKKCIRVEEVSAGKYVNIGVGCKFIHRGETRNSFFIREGFLSSETKVVVEETKAPEAPVETELVAVIDAWGEYQVERAKVQIETIECNAWKEKNSKIYTHEDQKQVEPIIPFPVKAKEDQVVKPQVNLTKTRMCESLSSGNPCRHGAKCRFAHSIDELNICECPHGTRCGFVQIHNGVFSNSEGKFCSGIHPKESRENYCSRNGIMVKVAKKKECCKTKTKICKSVICKVKCTRKVCDFAHNERELNIRECTFPNCKLVSRDVNGVVFNVNQENRCSFFHQGETKSSFFARLTC